MAKVLLRNYTREIERLIEQGQMDEAIAHCLHILNTFPKHLETYRLLGKAFLESRRYSEAVDVFGRVLMAAPDDFVAHVGVLSATKRTNWMIPSGIWNVHLKPNLPILPFKVNCKDCTAGVMEWSRPRSA